MRSRLRPGQILVLSFGCAILIGASLLSLPISSTGTPLGLIDALFTATSATCVTGLVVVDTGTALSSFGQVTVLVLIQLGGLGIMTFSSLLLLFGGRKLSFRDEEVLSETFGNMSQLSARTMLGRLFTFVIVAELLGAAALFPVFQDETTFGRAIYSSIFHSISAFCNAGFSLNVESLTAHRANGWLNTVLMSLIILGGTGFLVFTDLWSSLVDWRRKRLIRLNLHTKTILLATLILITCGSGMIAALEWSNGLAGMETGDKLLASLFQSVTTRTAGFNTLDFGSLADATLFLCIIFMFIGASPGSCAGGVKTSTIAVVLALFWSRFKGKAKVGLFKRTVPDIVVNRAVSILVLSFAFVVTMAFLLVLCETRLVSHQLEHGEWFLELMFEVVSAFGTVGLSTGITPQLTCVGKIVIIFVMFAGRLGPLTLALAIGRGSSKGQFIYAEESIMVG